MSIESNLKELVAFIPSGVARSVQNADGSYHCRTARILSDQEIADLRLRFGFRNVGPRLVIIDKSYLYK